MKKRITVHVLLYIAIVVFGSSLFFACPMPEVESVSISERIDMFISDANNGNYSNMYKHIHPDAAKYDQGKTANFWSSDFQDSNHSLSTLNISGEIVTSTISSTTYGTDTDIRFTMKEDGKDIWKILKLEIDPANDGFGADDVIVD